MTQKETSNNSSPTKSNEDTTTTTNSLFEVSVETSARVCKHMNEDHSLSVYAMARNMLDPLPEGWKISHVQMKKVTANGCHLQAVTCSGDMCAPPQQVTYPFAPPLTKAAQVKPRLVAIHHDVLSPQIKWIYTKPLALKLMLTLALVAYGTLVMGVDGIKARLDQSNLIKTFYPHTGFIAMALPVIFYITVVTHMAEAAYAAYTCRTTFKLHWKGTLQWSIMIFFVGFPILNEVLALQKFQQQQLKEAHEEEEAKKES